MSTTPTKSEDVGAVLDKLINEAEYAEDFVQHDPLQMVVDVADVIELKAQILQLIEGERAKELEVLLGANAINPSFREAVLFKVKALKGKANQ